MHEYYLNFEKLEEHYRQDHYICSHESCRAVVFETAIELQAHLHAQHSDGAAPNARSRALTVNLQQLHQHGANDPRPSHRGRNYDELERERQAARRRAFLSSHVVFSGASATIINEESSIASALPDAAASSTSASQSQSSSTTNTQQSRRGASSTAQQPAQQPAQIPRPPDDGKFHPSILPRTPEESTSRNAVLVRRMRSLLDPAAYEQFKESSSSFSDGTIDGDEYFDAAIDAFGMRTAVRDVLPELVALLPSPLLREPLLRTCLRRTNTEATLDSSVTTLVSTAPSASETASTSAAQSGSQADSQNGDESDVNFPSLNGNAVPSHLLRTPQRLRRFGAPGPEEFPRLGQAHRAPQPAPNPRPSVPAPRPPGGRGVPSARPLNSFPTLSQAHQRTDVPQTPQPPQPTAAAVARLRSPASVSAVANRSTLANGISHTTSTVTDNVSNAVSAVSSTVATEAFPSLSSNQPRAVASSSAYANASSSQGSFALTARSSGATSSTPPVEVASSASHSAASLATDAFPALGGSSSSSNGQAVPALNEDGAHPNHGNPDPDVSQRAGAVWGGATVTPGRKSKKKANGRRPASPPRVALERQQEQSSEEQDAGAGSSSSALGLSSVNRGKPRVIDVVEIARERKRSVQSSALPSLAKSAISGGRVTSSYASSTRKGKK